MKGERAEMSQESNYITIAEFSKRASITKQRVYQLLNKSLKEFVKEVDGVKKIHIKALERYESKADNSRVKQGFEQDFNNPLNDTLIKTIELLQEQLRVKDEQIAELHKIINGNQYLQAGTIQSLTEPGEQTKKKKGIFNLFNKKKREVVNND